MELDVPMFQRIEIFAWSIATFIFLFMFGHVFVFLGIAICVRYVYIRYKSSKLELLDPQGKTIVVTGCDSGFGLALAKRLSQRGFNVFATCLSLDSSGAKSLKEIEIPNHLTVLHLDITNGSMVQQVLEQVLQHCGDTGLWGLVNNAGQNFIGDAELTTMNQYENLFRINLLGMVRMCKAFLPLIRQAKGRIVNVTSVRGLIAVPVAAPYTITKYGGEAFSATLRQEMAGFGVKVIIVEPGNFGGITGCLNTDGIARIEKQLDSQWKEATEEVKQIYGKSHLQQHVEAAKKGAYTTHQTLEPVLEAFEDALSSTCPRVRYLVDGSNSYIDIYTTLARLSPFLPQKIHDVMWSYFFPYTIYKCIKSEPHK